MSARATPPSKEALIGRLEAALVARIGPARFGLWFPRHTIFLPNGDELVVGVATGHFQEWLEHTFGDAIRSAASEVTGGPLPVRFVVDPGLLPDAATADEAPGPPPTNDEQASDKADRPAQPTLFGETHPLPPHPRERRKPTDRGAPAPSARRFRRLDDFVVGACNRVAHASALAVVEEPGLAVNPLVLHGPVGTGKTHLLEGVYAGLRRAAHGRPCFVTAEEFTARFVQAARFGRQAAFRRQFRDCCALLLDDLQGLATKRATQEEFLYTFDALIAEGKQVVVTLDCHPRLAGELMPELVDRLLGGAVWGLLPPDDETRLGILRHRARGAEPAIPDEVLCYLARHLRGNVRELEGAVHSVRHYARVARAAVTVPLAREALGELLRHSVRPITLADVDGAVCRVLRLATGALQSKARSWAVTHSRAVAVYLARKHTLATYGEIARHFGVRTHSTAVAAEKKVRGWLAADRPLTIGDRAWRAGDLIDSVERELQR